MPDELTITIRGEDFDVSDLLDAYRELVKDDAVTFGSCKITNGQRIVASSMDLTIEPTDNTGPLSLDGTTTNTYDLSEQ